MCMCTGLTTNGEFNSLWWKGNSRPLCVLHIKSQARSKFQCKGLKTLMDMLTPLSNIYTCFHSHLCLPFIVCVVARDGSLSAKRPNSAISKELLKEILSWKKEGVSDHR